MKAPIRWIPPAVLWLAAATTLSAQSLVLNDGGLLFPDQTLQTTAGAVSALPRTGQTSCFAENGDFVACGVGVGAGQEGHLQRGVIPPIPRFTSNGDGTVTDNMTGLVWLEDADCDGLKNWGAAIPWANALFDGSTTSGGTNGDCGLSDGSIAGDWRVPNMFEATSLLDHAYSDPGVANTTGTGQWSEGDPFTGVATTYWTSTFNPQNKTFAHDLWVRPPFLSSNVKTTTYSVWPVRDGPDGVAGGGGDVAVALADGGIEFPDGSVQSTAAVSHRAVVPKTGQVSCYDKNGLATACGGSGQDGEYQAGVAWPTPRFLVNGDGTVTDFLTSLVWLENADCDGIKTWVNALSWANALFDGSVGSGGTNGDCGLSDGSLPGEWRVPSLHEFESLAYMETDNPAIPNTLGTGQWSEGDPFVNIPSGNLYWWTATSVESGPASAYLGFPRSQATATNPKTVPFRVWPVRDPR